MKPGDTFILEPSVTTDWKGGTVVVESVDGAWMHFTDGTRAEVASGIRLDAQSNAAGRVHVDADAMRKSIAERDANRRAFFGDMADEQHRYDHARQVEREAASAVNLARWELRERELAALPTRLRNALASHGIDTRAAVRETIATGRVDALGGIGKVGRAMLREFGKTQ